MEDKVSIIYKSVYTFKMPKTFLNTGFSIFFCSRMRAYSLVYARFLYTPPETQFSEHGFPTLFVH